MAEYIEDEYGGKVMGTSNRLADRLALVADLEAMPDADVLLVERKATAVDLTAKVALERGMEVMFCTTGWFPPEATARSTSWLRPPPAGPCSGSPNQRQAGRHSPAGATLALTQRHVVPSESPEPFESINRQTRVGAGSGGEL